MNVAVPTCDLRNGVNGKLGFRASSICYKREGYPLAKLFPNPILFANPKINVVPTCDRCEEQMAQIESGFQSFFCFGTDGDVPSWRAHVESENSVKEGQAGVYGSSGNQSTVWEL